MIIGDPLHLHQVTIPLRTPRPIGPDWASLPEAPAERCGQSIVSAGADAAVSLWVASIDDLLQMADERIQRPVRALTSEERRQSGLDDR